MAQIADGGGTETAAQRNARLQAAFNKTSTSTKTTTSTYVPAPSYTPPPTYVPAPSYTPPKVPTTYNVQDTQSQPAYTPPPTPAPTQNLDQRLYDVRSIQSTTAATSFVGATPTEQMAGQGGGIPSTISPYTDPVQQSTWQRSIDFVSQGSTQTYEDALIASAARLTGEAIFQYGQIPNVISTTVANQLPYTYYGYASADEFLEDLGYFEQSPGQWIQGDGGGTTDAGGGGTTQSGTTSYQRSLAGSGYTGRYAGASAGLINWRIGF